MIEAGALMARLAAAPSTKRNNRRGGRCVAPRRGYGIGQSTGMVLTTST
ncbi:hypothetical protein M8494_11505 [Serratia ureilytica]